MKSRIALMLMGLVLVAGAAEEPRFYSNELYRADFSVSPTMRLVNLDIGGRRLILGHRINSLGAGVNPYMMDAKNVTGHSFETLPDGLKYVYDMELVRAKTNEVLGAARQAFTFRPTQIVYEVTLTPKEPMNFKTVSEFFSTLVWARDAKDFQDVAVKLTMRNGTSAMNLVDFADGAFKTGAWIAGNTDVVRLDWATARELVTVTAAPEDGTAISFIRYGAKGENMGFSVRCLKPKNAPWEYVFDKPVRMELTFDVSRW